MSDATNNIYIDASFLSPSEGTEDVNIGLTLVDADNIGAYNIPIVYRTTAAGTAVQDINMEFFLTTYGYLTRENRCISVGFTRNATISGISTSLVDFSITDTNATGLDAYIDAFIASTTGSGVQCTRIDFIVGEEYPFYEDIVVNYWIWPAYDEVECITTSYTTGQATEFIRNIIAELEFSSPRDGFICVDIDSTFAGWVLNHLPVDVFATLSGTPYYVNFETTVSGGTFTGYFFDVFATSSGFGWVRNDIICSLMDYTYVPWEATTISGGMDGIRSTVFCTASGINYLTCDVELYSLKISNFSLSIDEYTSAYDSICVDVTDDMYNVVTSGTYFIIDGTAVSGTFSAIVDGYTMCYDPTDDFASLMGPTIFTVHAENDNGDSLERDYYLTYGYKVEFDNVYETGYDFGYDNKIVVRMTAENLASCPKTSADAYWFDIRSQLSKDLTATIRGTGGNIGLSASIYPDSTAYFYGKEFRVVINAKDFAGNEMEEFVLTYRIEDEPG